MHEYLLQLDREKAAREFSNELRTLRARLRYCAERSAHSAEMKARLSVIACKLEEAESLEGPDEIKMVIIDMGQIIVSAADLTKQTPPDLVN